MNPFDYVNDILLKKENLITDEMSEKEYLPYIVNRALSFHKDCIFQANEMNCKPHLDKKMQYDFLLNTVRGYKRPFAKWIKNERDENLDCIKAYYKVSDKKAREILLLLSKEQIQELKEKTDSGGLLRK